MKILYIPGYSYPLYPDKIYGGTESFVTTLSKLLAEDRCIEATIATSNDSNITWGNKIATVDIAKNFHPRAKELGLSYGAQAFRKLTSLLRSTWKGYFDLVHINWFTSSILNWVLETRTPAIFSIHSPLSQHSSKKCLDLMKQIREAGIPFAIVANSNYSAKYYEEFGMEKPDEVIYLASDLEIQPALIQSFAHENYVSMVGRICVEKGVHIAIQAAIKANVKLKLIGTRMMYPEAEHQYFETEVKPYLEQYPQLIEWREGVSRQEILETMRGASANIVPTTEGEGLSLVTLESLSVGTPVITFNHSALREIIDSPLVGKLIDFVDGKKKHMPKYIEDFAEAIKPENTAKFSRTAAYERYKYHFSQRVFLQKYLDLYRKLINK